MSLYLSFDSSGAIGGEWTQVSVFSSSSADPNKSAAAIAQDLFPSLADDIGPSDVPFEKMVKLQEASLFELIDSTATGLFLSFEDVATPQEAPFPSEPTVTNAFTNVDNPAEISVEKVSDSEKITLTPLEDPTVSDFFLSFDDDRGPVLQEAPIEQALVDSRPSSTTDFKRKKRVIWTPQEDRLLAEIVQNHKGSGKLKWRQVSESFNQVSSTSRSKKQCTERWTEVLSRNKPKTSWKAEEDRLLISLVATHGKTWASIAKKIGNGRFPRDLQNRYLSLCRKAPKPA